MIGLEVKEIREFRDFKEYKENSLSGEEEVCVEMKVENSKM